MGNAVAAIAGGTHAIEWNPAGVARATVPMAQVGLGFNPASSDLQVGTSGLYPFEDGTVFALSQFSDFPKAPVSSTTYVGTVALPLNSSRDILFGLNMKYLALSLPSGGGQISGRGFGTDFGISYDLRRPQGTVASFALAVKNADTQVRFDNNDEQSVTRSFVFGAAYQQIKDTRLESDYEVFDQPYVNGPLHNRLRLGVERFFNDRVYSVRMGYDDLFNNDGYFSMGAGYHPAQPYEITAAFRVSQATRQVSNFLSFVYRFDHFVHEEPLATRPASTVSPEINIASTVEDLTGNNTPSGQPVSSVPLRKMTIKVEPPIFSPAGKHKTAVITFPEGSQKDVARWVVEIQSKAKEAVRRVGGTGPLLPMLGWDGMGDDGRQVPDGKYRIALKTFNHKNELLSDDAESVEVASARTRFELITSGTCFSTKGGRKGKNGVQFLVNPGGPSAVQSWDFEISEASSHKVVFESQGKDKLPKSIRWNGRNLNNEVVSDGNYLCLLLAQDNAGNPLKTDALQITVSNTPPELNFKASDNLVDFKSKKTFRLALQAADMVEIQDWNVQITSDKGPVLKTISGKGLPPKEVNWDGSTDDGKMVEPGSLVKISFSASDCAGNSTRTDPYTVQVDYQPASSSEQMTLNLTTVYFAAMSSTLDEAAQKEIQKAAASVKPYLAKSTLLVKGYASTGETGDLVALSNQRANEVKKYLTKQLGLAPDAIYAVGYAVREPQKSAASPTTTENHRRALIMLTTQP